MIVNLNGVDMFAKIQNLVAYGLIISLMIMGIMGALKIGTGQVITQPAVLSLRFFRYRRPLWIDLLFIHRLRIHCANFQSGQKCPPKRAPGDDSKPCYRYGHADISGLWL